VLTVQAASVNRAPVITEGASMAMSGLEDATCALTLHVTDDDGDLVTWSISSQGAQGTASVSGTGASQVVTYVPDANQNGDDTVVVQVSDGRGGSDAIALLVTIAPVNDPPINQGIPVISGRSTVGWEQSATTGSWTDLDGAVVAFSYQWQRATSGGAFADIPGATASRYAVAAGDGGYALRVRVTATDDGTPGAASTVVHSAATVVILATATPVINATTTTSTMHPTLSGTSVPGATIRIYDNGVCIGAVTADATGRWTWTVVSPLTVGAHALTVTAERAPTGESAPAGPVLVVTAASGSGGTGIGGSGNDGSCGSGSVTGLLLGLCGLFACLRRRR
jgi:hypothetical protein